MVGAMPGPGNWVSHSTGMAQVQTATRPKLDLHRRTLNCVMSDESIRCPLYNIFIGDKKIYYTVALACGRTTEYAAGSICHRESHYSELGKRCRLRPGTPLKSRKWIDMSFICCYGLSWKVQRVVRQRRRSKRHLAHFYKPAT